MKKLEVKLNFLNSLPELARKFRFASDTFDKSDNWIDYKNNNKIILGEKNEKIIEENLINTENPHIQLRKTIRIDLEIHNVTRAVLFEFFRNSVGNNHLDNSDAENYYFNRVNNDPDDFVACVKSTRYSLHRIAKDNRIIANTPYLSEENFKNIKFESREGIVNDYYYIPEDDFDDDIEERVDWINTRYCDLIKIKYYKKCHNMTNDKLKKYVNDYMYCNLTASVSGEWLWNFLKQRLDSCAFYQIQDLAKEINNQIPDEWKNIFKVYKYKKINIDPELIDFINNDKNFEQYQTTWEKQKLRELINKNLVEKIYLN